MMTQVQNLLVWQVVVQNSCTTTRENFGLFSYSLAGQQCPDLKIVTSQTDKFLENKIVHALHKGKVVMVGSIQSSIVGEGTLQYMLRATRKGKQEALEPTPETLADPALNSSIHAQASASSSLMARNFASAEREESRYTKATLDGLKAGRSMENQEQNALTSIMQQAKMEYENAETLGEKYKTLKRAEKKIFWHQEDEVRKQAEETHLKKSKEELEEKAQESLAPKDAEGNPIPDAAGTDSGAAPVAEPAPAPVAEPAPAPETVDVAAVEVESAAVAEVATPEITSAPSAPAAPAAQVSIDIKV